MGWELIVGGIIGAASATTSAVQMSEQHKAQKKAQAEQDKLARADRASRISQSADITTTKADMARASEEASESRRRRAFNVSDTVNNTTLLGGSLGRKTLG